MIAYGFFTAFFVHDSVAEYFDVIKPGRVTIFMNACLLCSDFVLKLSEVSYAEVLGNKSNIHSRVTL